MAAVVVMESNRDRPHPIRTLSTDEQQHQQLFLCFTSRLSSSSSPSMKLSKSILSPGRSARDISLSSSLSRRLKTNPSLKGGQSPMFPSTTTTSTARKKTGAGYENPEPSSPKVTCIGQVRVKSKKKKTNQHHHYNHNHNQLSNIRSRSQRRSVDFSSRRIDTNALEDGNSGLKRQSSTSYRNREIELEGSQRHGHGRHSNNQKWVHIPVTICESLRSFGSDFNCFLPCRSDKEHHHHQQQQQQEQRGGGEKNGCGSVLARWLVAVQEGEGGEKGGRQIELVVGGGDDDEDDGEICGRRSYRKRHVMEDIDIKEIEKSLKERVEIVDGRRVSVCVPPKNALLLMRCGSDPIKMAALANRFWEPPEKEEEDDEKDVGAQHMALVKEEDVGGAYKECETRRAETVFVSESDVQVNCNLVVPGANESVSLESEMPEVKDEDENLCDKFVTEEMYEDVLEEELSADAIRVLEDNGLEIPKEHHQVDYLEAKQKFHEEEMSDVIQEEEVIEADHLVSSPSSIQEEECIDVSMEQSQSESIKVDYDECNEQAKLDSIKVDYDDNEESDKEDDVVEEKQNDTSPADKEKESSALPDCLLLMMCEPKLSMEVSQETWVCTTDFIRWLPPREPNKTATATTKKKDDDDEPAATELLSKRVSIHYKPPKAPPQKAQENPQFIPPRSSCSYPAPPAKHESACEPLYNLTRCKSEPRRAAAKLAAAGQPESCFWKNRQRAVGAAGMGF